MSKPISATNDAVLALVKKHLTGDVRYGRLYREPRVGGVDGHSIKFHFVRECTPELIAKINKDLGKQFPEYRIERRLPWHHSRLYSRANIASLAVVPV
ncbi:hypothetical protein VPHD479_0274 [Vibrio phage D479]